MEFEELQKQWKAIKAQPRSHDEWRSMMNASPAWRFKKISRSDITEMIKAGLGLSVILLINGQTYTWAKWILTAYCVFMALDQFLGLRYMQFHPIQASMEKSLNKGMSRIKWILWFQRINHVTLWILVALFAASKIQLGPLSMLWWALIFLPVLIVASWLSTRKWSRKIKEIKEMLDSIHRDETQPAVQL